MGTFYVNFTVCSGDTNTLTERLKATERQAYVYPAANEMTVVYDEGCDLQDPEQIDSLGRDLSSVLVRPVLAALNHDDDILVLALYESGEEVASYNSAPDYFETETDEMPAPEAPREFAAQLCRICGHADTDSVAAILEAGFEQYPFATLRHEALASALGLPGSTVGVGYEYIELGELPQEMQNGTLVKISSTSA